MDNWMIYFVLGVWCYGWVLGLLSTMYEDIDKRQFPLYQHLLFNMVFWPIIIFKLIWR